MAGITISAITGNENAMKKAQQAKQETDAANELEEIKLAVVSAMVNETDGKVSAENLRTALTGIIDNTSGITGNGPWTVTGKSGAQYKIYSSGNVEKIGNAVAEDAGLYKEDGTFISWDDLVTAGSENKVFNIYTVTDENGDFLGETNKTYQFMMPSVVEIPEGSYTLNDLDTAFMNWDNTLWNEGIDCYDIMWDNGSKLSGKLVVKEGIQVILFACAGSHLKEVKLPASIEALNKSYADSSELEKVTLSNPTSLKVVEYAFDGCTNLKEFVYNGDLNDIINAVGLLDEIDEIIFEEIYSINNFYIVKFNGEYYKIEQDSQTDMLIATKMTQEQVDQMILYEYNVTGITELQNNSGVQYIKWNNKYYKRTYNTSTQEVTNVEEVSNPLYIYNLDGITELQNNSGVQYIKYNNKYYKRTYNTSTHEVTNAEEVSNELYIYNLDGITELQNNSGVQYIKYNNKYYKRTYNTATHEITNVEEKTETEVMTEILSEWNVTGISKIYEQTYYGIEYVEFNNKRYKRKYNTSTHEITQLEDLTGKVAVVLKLRGGYTDKNGECISFEPRNNTKWIDWADDLSRDNIIIRGGWNEEISLKSSIKTIGNSTSNYNVVFDGFYTEVKILKSGEAINPTQEFMTEGVYIYSVEIGSEIGGERDYETEFK